MLTALAMIHREAPCRLVALAAVLAAIGAGSFQPARWPAIASNPCRHQGGAIWATARQITVAHGMIVQWPWPWLLDAWEFGKLVVRFFDKASFVSLFLLALVTYEVGRRSCGLRHQQVARLLAGGLLLAYFVYRFVVFPDHGWEQLLFSAARAFLTAWLSCGVLFFVVPLADGLRRGVNSLRHLAMRWTKAACHWVHEIWHRRRARRRRRAEPAPEPPRPVSYAESLSESVRQIREQFEAEQAVLDQMGEELAEDEAGEFQDLPRQKMLRRLYKTLGEEEGE